MGAVPDAVPDAVPAPARPRANAPHLPAAYDELTGLASRTQLTDYLDAALARPSADADTHVAALYCDIDRFRVVNDSLGRDAGDDLLRIVAQRLEATVRCGCCDGAVVGRIASDEFAVVCDSFTDTDDVVTLARNIQAAFEDVIVLGGDRIKVHVSVGLVLARNDDFSGHTLLRHAEAAHARAKADGGSIGTFDARMQRRAHDRLRTELDLAGAAERGELRLYYQPIVAATTGGSRGMEALVRWQHPDRGLLSPVEFIPLAEETGLIREVGHWVTMTGFTQSRAWYDRGVDKVRVGVNISARELNQDGFVESVALLLERLDAGKVLPHMELTESALMTDPERSAAVLRELRDIGVRLSLDDFGTGYSSMAYLQRFPVDILKIDRSFIDGIDRDSRNRALVRAMVQLGHALDLEVLAEGIETSAERRVVEDVGCDLLQGFLIAKPMPEPDLWTQGFLPG